MKNRKGEVFVNPKNKDDEDVALTQHYHNQMNSFFIFRMFAGMYQQATREEYLDAVGQLLKSYEAQMKSLVQIECNKMQVDVRPGVENVAIGRFRIRNHEAIAHVIVYTKSYLIALNNAMPEKPPESGEPPPAATATEGP